MISVDGLTVEFGDRALFKDISFQINENGKVIFSDSPFYQILLCIN